MPFPSWQLTDITGTTGMAILQAIVKGERDPVELAQLKHMQVKSNAETIASAPEGDYRPEHLFALKTALELYDFYQLKILECDRATSQQLEKFECRSNPRSCCRSSTTPRRSHANVQRRPLQHRSSAIVLRRCMESIYRQKCLDLESLRHESPG